MDDKTLQALTALAEKFGTTAEYIWLVLIKQAPITGLADMAIMIFLVAAVTIWARTVQRKTTVSDSTESNRYPKPQWDDEGKFFGWASVWISALIVALVIASTFSITISAFANPEYWALKQIIH